MATTKKTLFSAESLAMSNFAKALSHPARIEILKLLSLKKTCVCGSIVSELPLSQATISQHLKELKNAGLIVGEVEGPRVCYCIHKENFEKVKNQFIEIIQQII
jgi:ArsR family transcriptional regulator, arsenate/arsenite/antimonite-responsive transcriptional repressor